MGNTTSHPTAPEEWATFHREIAGDRARWERETDPLPRYGRRILDFGGGRYRQMAHCKGCHSAITRRVRADELRREDLALALAVFP